MDRKENIQMENKPHPIDIAIGERIRVKRIRKDTTETRQSSRHQVPVNPKARDQREPHLDRQVFLDCQGTQSLSKPVDLQD